MESLVICASQGGAAGSIAQAIAAALEFHGRVEAMDVADAPEVIPAWVDLLVVGGPTEGRGLSPQLADYLVRLQGSSMRARCTAVFDTRLDLPRWLSGCAADRAAERLRAMGAKVIATPESFLVTVDHRLELGELERAVHWGRTVARRVGPRTVVFA